MHAWHICHQIWSKGKTKCALWILVEQTSLQCYVVSVFLRVPTSTKSAVFLNIVQTAVDPPPFVLNITEQIFLNAFFGLNFSHNNEETKMCPIFWVELSNREEEHISWPKYFLDLSCSNNALYVHNAFPLQMFSASMGHFLRFLMYILIHSTSPRHCGYKGLFGPNKSSWNEAFNRGNILLLEIWVDRLAIFKVRYLGK